MGNLFSLHSPNRYRYRDRVSDAARDEYNSCPRPDSDSDNEPDGVVYLSF